jgi:hypothetical protein
MALGGMALIGGDLWDKRPETTWDYVSLICLMVLVGRLGNRRCGAAAPPGVRLFLMPPTSSTPGCTR